MKLAGSNIVQTVDISTGEPWRGSLETLFEKYAANVTYKPGVDILCPDDVRMTDWTGWSRIVTIHRIHADHLQWMKVNVYDQSVICTSDSELLEWQDAEFRRVFQGRPVWQYKCIALGDVTPESRGRCFCYNHPSFFDNYIIEPIDHDRTVYYQIYTQSKFYNVNRIVDTSIGCGESGEKGWR